MNMLCIYEYVDRSPIRISLSKLLGNKVTFSGIRILENQVTFSGNQVTISENQVTVSENLVTISIKGSHFQ